MHLHTLEFTHPESLSSAFELLTDSARVEDCMAEPDLLRLRFVAEAGPADELIERIYLTGGLRWSTRAPLARPRLSLATAIQEQVHGAR